MFYRDGQRAVRALVADDDAPACAQLAETLEELLCEVRTAGTGDEALAKAHSFRPDIVFLKASLPEQDGWLVCAKLKLRSDAPVVVLMCDHGAGVAQPAGFAEFVHADELLTAPVSAADALRLLQETVMA